MALSAKGKTRTAPSKNNRPVTLKHLAATKRLAHFNGKLEAYQTNAAQNLIVSERPPILYAMPVRRSLIGRRSDAAAVLVALLPKPEVSRLV